MKDFLVIAAGRFFVLVAGVAMMKLSTTIFSPLEIASQNQFAALASILASGGAAPLIVYFARGVPGWFAAGILRAYSRRMLLALFLMSFPLAALGWSLAAAFDLVSGIKSINLLALLWVYLLLFPMHYLFANCVSAMAERRRGVLYNTAVAWASVFLALLLESANPGIEFWILGTNLGYLIVIPGLLVLIFGKRHALSEDVRECLPVSRTAVWRFWWPQFLIFSLWWVQLQSYRFILPSFAGNEAVGLFFVAHALASVPMQAFESVMGELCSPALYRQAREGSLHDAVSAWQEYVSIYVPAILVFSGYLYFALPLVGTWLIGDRFHIVLSFLLLPILAEAMRALSSTILAFGLARVDMRTTVPVVAVGAVFSVVGLVTFTALLPPLVAAGASLFFAATAAFIVVIAITSWKIGAKWPVRTMVKACMLSFPFFFSTPLLRLADDRPSLSQVLPLLMMGTVYFLALIYALLKRANLKQ